MGTFLTLAMALLPAIPFSPVDPIRSGVFRWHELTVERTAWGERRPIIAGEAHDLSLLEVEALTLNPGESAENSHLHVALEEMVIVKDGFLTATVGDQTKVLGPASVAAALAGDTHQWRNEGTAPVTFYVIRLASRTGVDAERGSNNPPSMIIDERQVDFVANPRGGSRNFFNRSTATLRLYELHETTLVAGVQNHAPHTHPAEEMVIMLDGHVEMEIGGRRLEAKAGDVYFIASGDPHTLFTRGSSPSRYFAFQWR